MFDEKKKEELISLITKQPEEPFNGDIYYRMHTLAQNCKNLTNKEKLLKYKELWVIAERSLHPGEEAEVDWKKHIEKTYNYLESKPNRPVPQNEICEGKNVKRSAFAMKALSLLSEFEYDKPTNSLKYIGFPK
jgi:hypothetical protein